jgi:hypothetical protein
MACWTLGALAAVVLSTQPSTSSMGVTQVMLAAAGKMDGEGGGCDMTVDVPLPPAAGRPAPHLSLQGLCSRTISPCSRCATACCPSRVCLSESDTRRFRAAVSWACQPSCWSVKSVCFVCRHIKLHSFRSCPASLCQGLPRYLARLHMFLCCSCNAGPWIAECSTN